MGFASLLDLDGQLRGFMGAPQKAAAAFEAVQARQDIFEPLSEPDPSAISYTP